MADNDCCGQDSRLQHWWGAVCKMQAVSMVTCSRGPISPLDYWTCSASNSLPQFVSQLISVALKSSRTIWSTVQ
jgi:hypothetical protein